MLDLSNPKHAHIEERLRDNLIVWLTTVRPDGRPHSVAVWYLWEGGDFLIFSKPNQQKLRNLRHNPNVVLALDDTDEGADLIVIEGSAELLSDPDISVTLAAYKEKYARKLAELGWTAESMAASYSQGIRIVPTKIQ